MKVREKAIAAGVVTLAGGWLWVNGVHDSSVPRGPVRTKSDAFQRAGDHVRLASDPVSLSGVVTDAGGVSPSPAECRDHAEAARAEISPSQREELTRRAVQEWAMLDAAGAMEWAARLPDVNESRIAMQQICSRLTDEDPAKAIRLAWDHGLDEAPGDFMGGLTAGWAARDLHGAREWLESQTEGELRDRLMGPVVFELAKTDPATAARMVAEEMGNGESQREAAISVLHQWATREPEAAASWVDTFPDGELKEMAWRELRAQGTRDR